MSREIKFRAWNGKYMVPAAYGDWVSFDGVHYEEAPASGSRNIEIKKVKGTVLMQFTGLLDVDGKEIYEDDILGCITDFFSGEIHTLGVVKWFPELCGFTIEAKLFKDDEGYTMTVYSTQENSAEGNKQLKRKVLGNIYENPELLTK